MSTLYTFLIATAVTMFFSIFCAHPAVAVGPKVSELAQGNTRGNKHNLSAIARQFGTTTQTPNLNKYQADSDAATNPKGQQICIFCHTPHSANVEGGAPLWNRKFSAQTFSRYSSGTLQVRINSAISGSSNYTPAWQPDGSSKLCLSCHDGVSSLGALMNETIKMATTTGGGDVISSDTQYSKASFSPSTNKMKTGHHPVSFKYDGSIPGDINSARTGGYRTSILPDFVKLDRNGKMQCTTCHNAHQNQTDDTACYEGICTPTDRKKAPFWVYGASGVATTDRDDVCTSCHNITTPPPNSPMTPL